MKEKDGKTDKTDKSKKVDPVPSGDLFLVENSDDILDRSAQVWTNNGRAVERVNSRQEVIDKIKAKSQALGRKIHAEIEGNSRSATESGNSSFDPREGRFRHIIISGTQY